MKLWKWQEGRQEGCKYQKFPLWYFRIWKLGFDAYILDYEDNTLLPIHKDPVKGKHWRLNIKLFGNSLFFQENRGYVRGRFVFFRPDLYFHYLKVFTRTRKLSFGFVKFD